MAIPEARNRLKDALRRLLDGEMSPREFAETCGELEDWPFFRPADFQQAATELRQKIQQAQADVDGN